MRIPLDYYRILSVPIKATPVQLEQAYSDRLLQQPRREYNEIAIKARQELIQHAYQILSNSEQRAEYDAQFLVNMQPVEVTETEATAAVFATEEVTPHSSVLVADNPPLNPPLVTPTIEVATSMVMGALLIFHELGEYELALKLGIDYFNSREFREFQQQQSEEINVATEENIILSLALAYLELGREQWHRQEYENAALSGQLGLDLLTQENLFPQLQEELATDLFKLRPYRVLELISQNAANSPERARGFQLLREMLIQRQGIEGKGEDRSGLSFDQFLCFIQQLRTYLTSAEQQQLFEHETQSNSAIANYLAVYALLGRGFSLKQPELILRAQRKLDSLSEKQNVAWEKAVSALLLGHTEKALKQLHNSQDQTKLAQIKQHCAESIDLLPGICFYGEKWLLEDVMAQFTDLATIKLSLKEYFADREVQTYLEQLAPPTPSIVTQTNIPAPESKQIVPDTNKSQTVETGIFSRWRKKIFSVEHQVVAKVSGSNQFEPERRELVGANVSHGAQQTAILEQNQRTSQTIAKPSSKRTNSPPRRQGSKTRKGKNKPNRQRTKNSRVASGHPTQTKAKSLSLPLQSKPQHRAVPPSVVQKAQGKVVNKNKRVVRKKKLDPATFWKGWLFIFSVVLGTGTIAFTTASWLLNPGSKTATNTNNSKVQLAIAISQPAVELPPVKPKPVAVKPKLTFTDKSRQVIQKWLSSKSAAFGQEHQIDELNNILAEPLLSTWRNRAVAYQQGNVYRQYEHEIQMRSATINPQDPNKATVEAEVKEVAQHYQSGKLDNTQSYNDNLLVRYQLIRQGENWLIQNSEVLKTL